MNNSSAPDNRSPGAEAENHYQVLGVLPDADPLVISAAYKALIKKHHPDANGGRESPEARRINQAFNVVGDVHARARYDARMRVTHPHWFGSFNRAGADRFRGGRAAPGRHGDGWHSYRPAGVSGVSAHRADWGGKQASLDKRLKVLRAICALAAGGILLAMLIQPSFDGGDEGLSPASMLVQQEPASAGRDRDENSALPDRARPSPVATAGTAGDAWLVGSWVREGEECEPSNSTIFFADHKWADAKASGTWELADNKLTLETAASPKASSDRAETRVKTILAVAPREFQVANALGPTPISYDRCGKEG